MPAQLAQLQQASLSTAVMDRIMRRHPGRLWLTLSGSPMRKRIEDIIEVSPAQMAVAAKPGWGWMKTPGGPLCPDPCPEGWLIRLAVRSSNSSG